MKTRKPWLAFTLSFLCPGLGQLYNGNLVLAGVALAVGTSLALASTPFLFDALSTLLAAMLVGFVFDLIFAIQALREARRLKAVDLRPFQRWWAYVAFAAVLYGLPDGYGLFMPTRLMSFQIPSESMLPNLQVGDRLIADGWAFWGREPQRGQIVVFDYPRDPSIKYVKRLIGLPGDVVEVRNGVIVLNGQEVEQTSLGKPEDGGTYDYLLPYKERIGDNEYKILRSISSLNLNHHSITVPEGKYFVMGDNRDHSSDSRVWGFVDRSQLIASMQFIYFSWDSKDSQIRKDRFGLKVR